jgi:hypothetical protein
MLTSNPLWTGVGEEKMVTSWHELTDEDLDQRLDEMNERLQAAGYRSRFKVVTDAYGWDVLFDDGGEPEIVDTVEEADEIMDEFCC